MCEGSLKCFIKQVTKGPLKRFNKSKPLRWTELMKEVQNANFNNPTFLFQKPKSSMKNFLFA